MKSTKIPDKNIKFFGRTYFDNNAKAVYFNWSCSGFEFILKGSKAEAEFLSSYVEDKYAAFLMVLVDCGSDSETQRIIKLDKAKSFYTLAENLPDSSHYIKIIKITECQYATAGITQIRYEGELQGMPVKTNKPKIEFIGDSITCGFGNMSVDPDEEFSTSTENGYISFASLTARELGCDYNIVALSGWATHKSPYGGCLPDVYGKTDAINDKSLAEWDFDNFQADIVVLGLGTNDSSWTETDPTKLDEFEKAYYDFLHVIRGKYPDAYIICILGSLVAPDHPIFDRIKNAVALFNDSKTEFIKLDCTNKEIDGMGCGHPSAKKHRKNADLLIEKLRNYML